MNTLPTPHARDLPKALTALPNWVAWRTEVRPGSTKPTKVPYNLRTGEKAASNNPADWCDIPDPSEVPEGYDGIGFVLTKEAGIIGIDLDACLDEHGDVKEWALPILRDFGDTYFEISPSNTGIKIFAGGSLPGDGKGVKVYIDENGNLAAKELKDADGKRASDEAVEMYGFGRYFTVTGRIAGASSEVTNVQAAIDKLYRELTNLRKPQATTAATGATGEPVVEGSRHNYLLGVAGRLRNEGFDRDALLVSIRDLNHRVCTPPKPEHEIRGIVDYVLGKPPKYRLTPEDYKSAAKTASGEVIDFPKTAQVKEVTADILEYTEYLLVAAIESKDPTKVLGVGTEPSELIQALAQAGTIKQHEARRRIKAVFKTLVPLGELDARIKACEGTLRTVNQIYSQFITNSEGGLVPNVANAMEMLRAMPLQFNSFTVRAVTITPTPWGTQGDWTDHDDVKGAEFCQRKLLNVAPHVVAAAAEAVARERTPHYHPVAEYLGELKWDGEPRLDTWLTNYLGVAPSTYNSQVGRKWMISGVARVREPGVQADYTLVLEGDQGKRKSSALRVLAKDWFTDDISDIGTKDSALQLQGKWIVEIAELAAFGRSEMETVKAWLVRREDNFRPPYGRRAQDFKRQNIFAASTNKTDWLRDETGGRRFWPVVVGNIDIEGLAKAVDQLWAEAVFYQAEGELHYLTETTEALANTAQHSRQERDAWTTPVRQWIQRPVPAPHSSVPIRSTTDCFYLEDILQHCLGMVPKDWHHGHKTRVTRILRLAGCSARRHIARVTDADPDLPLEYWSKKGEC